MAAPELLNTLERSDLSTWIRESESSFAYYFFLVIHNIGQGTQEEDSLFLFTLTGHYRYAPEDLRPCSR